MSPGTPTHRHTRRAAPALLCALAPCILFLCTMATRVAHYAFMWHPMRWLPALPSCVALATPLPRPFFCVSRPRVTCSLHATSYHVRTLLAIPKAPLPNSPSYSRRGPAPGAIPHVPDGYCPVRQRRPVARTMRWKRRTRPYRSPAPPCTTCAMPCARQRWMVPSPWYTLKDPILI